MNVSTSNAPPTLQCWSGHGGVPIAGELVGDPSHRLVVLLHGGGQTRHAWKGVVEALAAQGYRVLAFDARGHGDSGWAEDGDYSLDAMVEDLRLVLQQVASLQLAALVGASMGGLVSLVAVGEGCIDASALLLVDVAPVVNPPGRQRILDFMAPRPEGFGTLEEVADLIAAYQPHRTRPATTDGLSKNLRLMENGNYRWHWDPAFHANASTWGDDDGRLTAAARKLHLPVLLVRGQMSDVMTEAGAREFLELCPAAEHVTVGDAGHMVAGDRNDAFGAAVLDFLARRVA